MNRSGPDFEAFFDQCYADVVRFAARRVGRGSAEDIAAEAFAVAWRRQDALPGTSTECRAWVFGIARNLMLAHARRAGRASLPVLVDATQVPSAGGLEESIVELAVLQQAWSKLNDEQREVLALTAWDELSGREAGAVLGISAGAYRIRLTRARAALRRLVDDAASAQPRTPSTASPRSIR